MAGKYYLLCEVFNKQTYIYAIKSNSTDWHYFEEEDSNMNVHTSLPADLGNQTVMVNELHEVSVGLDSEKVQNYITDGKFVFNEKELKTYIELAGIETEQRNSTRRKSSNSVEDLVFVEGKSNPAVFLKEFEKCDDTKTDKDKLFKIRKFVNPEHRSIFSNLFFKSDWSTARSTFLKKYSLAFVTNKKAALDFTFFEESNLRLFVLRKMKALSTYTRLSVENQLEIVLNELPVEVSNLFIIHDKMNSSKTEILEFCDTIHEIIADKNDGADQNVTLLANPNEQNRVVQDLEVCNMESYSSVNDSSDVETSDVEKASGRKNLRKSVKRSRGAVTLGRPSKIKKKVCDDVTDEDEYQSATSSLSNF